LDARESRFEKRARNERYEKRRRERRRGGLVKEIRQWPDRGRNRKEMEAK